MQDPPLKTKADLLFYTNVNLKLQMKQFDGDLLMERIHSDFLEQFDVVEDYLYGYFGKNSN